MSSGLQRGRESPPQWNQAGPQHGRDSPSRNQNFSQTPNQNQPVQHPPAPYPGYPPIQQQQQPPQPYPPHYQQHPPGQGPPHQQHPQSDPMLTLPPPPQVPHDMYRQPPPPPHYEQHQYAQQQQQQQPPLGYPQQPQQAVTFNQPAPRQRTAIACRYCRRRKIRCHGFDQNPEGRCSNCVRFNQECIFTPVSSQTHAFVPAHTAYPHLRNQGRLPQTTDGRPLYPQQGGPPLYGAHGQPLGPAPPPAHSDYPPPPNPNMAYVGGPAPYPTAPPSFDTSRGPPHHAPPHDDQNRRISANGYDQYPDPNHMTPISPASTSAGYQHNQQYQGSYYGQPQGQHPNGAVQQPTPTSRTSPTSNYGRNNGSASPHGGSVNAGPGGSYGPYPGNLHPPQVLPPANDGRNPSPAGQPRDSGRPNGMRINDMLDNSQSQGGRSNTDSNMLGLLNKRAP